MNFGTEPTRVKSVKMVHMYEINLQDFTQSAYQLTGHVNLIR